MHLYIYKKGDAHLKNFGVLYATPKSPVRLSPAYDIVTTTVYLPKDSLALTLNGSKRWPSHKTLLNFARLHCDISVTRSLELMEQVAKGMVAAMQEMTTFINQNAYFQEIGLLMQSEWEKGLQLSILPENRPKIF